MSRMTSLLSFAAATLIAAGAGGAFGLQIASMAGKMADMPPAHDAAHVMPKGAQLQHLPPIITNLAAPDRVWLRLEASVLLAPDLAKEGEALAAQLAADLVTFLRTVSLPQIQGGSGFQHLREDLNDRVRIRSNGKIRELFIQTLVVE